MSALTWVGAISTIAGIALVVLTQGRMGVRAIAIGVGLIGLSYVMAQIDLDWVLIPIYIGIGAITLAWASMTVLRILNRRSG